VAHSAQEVSAQWLIVQKPILRYGTRGGMNVKVKYLGEIEVIFKMALVKESGDQVGSIHEKFRGPKSRETIHLSLISGRKVFHSLSLLIRFFEKHFFFSTSVQVKQINERNK
jgi:hypothetical protein